MSTHEVNLFMKTFQTYESHGIVQQFLHIFQWISQSTQAPGTIGKMSWIAACALRMLAWLWYSFRAGDEVPDDDDADEEEDEFTDFSLSWVVRSGWVIKACPSTPSSEAKATSSGIRAPGVGACGEAGDCSSGFLSSTSFSTVKAIGTGACGELEAASCSSGFLSSKASLWSWGCSSGFLSSKASLWSSNAGHGDRDADAVRARFCSDFRSHCSNLAWASSVHPPLAPTTSWKPRWMLQICIWIRRAVMVALDGCTSKVPSAICRITTSGSGGVSGCCPALAWGSNSKTIFLPGIRMARPRTSMAQGVLLTGPKFRIPGATYTSEDKIGNFRRQVFLPTQSTGCSCCSWGPHSGCRKSLAPRQTSPCICFWALLWIGKQGWHSRQPFRAGTGNLESLTGNFCHSLWWRDLQ